MKLEQRLYGIQALDAIVQNYMAGVYQQLLVMATGTGKTVIFSQLYEKVKHLFGGQPKMLVFAHREELVDQAVATLRDLNPTLKIGKEMAEYEADIDCNVVVSCVASIGREGATRLQRFDGFDIVVCDEAHHSIATTYLNVFTITGVLAEGSKKLLVGFTATPKRKNLTRSEQKKVTTLDEENILQLKSVYRQIVFSYPIRKAIKDGWLVPLKGFRLKTAVSLDEVKTTAGDYQQDQLASTVNNDERNLQIVKAYLEYGEGRQTVVFTVDIKHAKDLAEVFRKYDVKAEPIWGADPERAEKIKRHKSKDITVLTNAQVLTEGYDDWRVSCIIPAAPTKNSSKFTQEIGRGTRLQADTGNLLDAINAGRALEKRDCYIIDVVDNSKRCSLVTFPSLLGLNPDMDLHGEDAVKAAETMEELQDKYPGVDLTKLVDITKVKAYIESIDMFEAPYTEEVKEFSKLTWMATQDGSYVLSIPEKRDLAEAAKKNGKLFARYLHEKLHISLNELDEYELSITTTETEKKLGTFNTLQEAFTTADDVIRRCRPDRVKLMVREAEWHQYLASEPAKRYLRKLTKNKPLIWCICDVPKGSYPLPAGKTCPKCRMKTGLTAGQAATALNRLHAN